MQWPTRYTLPDDDYALRAATIHRWVASLGGATQVGMDGVRVLTDDGWMLVGPGDWITHAAAGGFAVYTPAALEAAAKDDEGGR